MVNKMKNNISRFKDMNIDDYRKYLLELIKENNQLKDELKELNKSLDEYLYTK